MSWTIGGTTVASRDGPLATSDYPDIQQDIFVEQQPIGATDADSTVVTFTGSASLRARLDFLCSETMHDLLDSLKQTTFDIIDPWSNTRSWYLMRLDSRHVPYTANGAEKFNIVAHLIGR